MCSCSAVEFVFVEWIPAWDEENGAGEYHLDTGKAGRRKLKIKWCMAN
jgi:hypothetical protein